LITVEVEKNTLRALEKKLDSAGKKIPNVMKKAINETAKQARKQLASEAQKTYVIKSGRFNKSMTLKNATNGHLEAIIGSTGRVTELKDFKVSPSRFTTGESRPSIVKGKGLRSNSMKKLQKGDIKAFIVKFASGHVSVAQRLGKKRLPVKILYSTSIPKMLGNEQKVYGLVEPDIYKNLQMNLKKYISQALEE
jgi:hypothetical protein